MFFHAIEMFGFIKVSATYGRDAEWADIQLAIDEVRMTRWATSIGLKETSEVSWADFYPKQEEAQLVRRAVGNVTECIEGAVRDVTRHSSARQAATEAPQAKKLREHVLRYFSGMRNATRGAVAKAIWVVFYRTELNNLLNQIDKNLTILEDFEKGRLERERLAAEEVPSTAEERAALLEACSRDRVLKEALEESGRSRGPQMSGNSNVFQAPIHSSGINTGFFQGNIGSQHFGGQGGK